MAIYHKTPGITTNLLRKGEQWQPQEEAMFAECNQPYFGLEHHDHSTKKFYDKVCLIINYIIRGKMAQSIISMKMQPKGMGREMALDCRDQCKFQLHLRSKHP